MPGKLDGRPVVRETRVEADIVPEPIELGQTPEQIAAISVEAFYKAHVNSLAPVR